MLNPGVARPADRARLRFELPVQILGRHRPIPPAQRVGDHPARAADRQPNITQHTLTPGGSVLAGDRCSPGGVAVSVWLADNFAMEFITR